MNNKLREALENSNGLLEELACIGEWYGSAQEQIKENNAALAAPAEPISNEAKLRETLICIDNIISHIEVENVRDILHAYKNIHDRIRIALSTPARNCDVGAVEEQIERWRKFCHKFKQCDECPHMRNGELLSHGCFARWAQMPYEEEKEIN